MSYLRDRPSCNVHPQNAYKSLCVCARLSPVTSGLSLVKFDISILPVQDISDCLFYGECEIWGCHKCVAEDPDRVGSDVVSIGRVVLGVWMGITCATWPQRSCRKWQHVIGRVVLGVWMGIICAAWPQRCPSVAVMASYYRRVGSSALLLCNNGRICKTCQKSISFIKCVFHFLLQFCLIHGFPSQ